MTKSGDLCRTTCLAAGGVITLALIIGLGGTMGVFWGLLFGLILGGLVTVLMLRFICLADVKTGPVMTARTQSAGAMHAPAAAPGGEATVTAAEPVEETAAAPETVVAEPVKEPEAAREAPVAEAEAAEEAPDAEPLKPRKPRVMKQPRKAGPDDLKQIKGIGPKAEELLNGMGIFHVSQIAKWTEAEVAWADENLTGLKGRVSRDEWVAQAQALEAGPLAEGGDDKE